MNILILGSYIFIIRVENRAKIAKPFDIMD